VDEMSNGEAPQAHEDPNESMETEKAKLDGFTMKARSGSFQSSEKPEETKATQAAKLFEEQKRQAARAARKKES
jgi:hypothetical protein